MVLLGHVLNLNESDVDTSLSYDIFTVNDGDDPTKTTATPKPHPVA